jgi:hypothetical protein
MVGILPWIRSLAGEADLNQKLFEWVLGAEMYVTSVFREVTLENNCWIQIGRLHVVLDAGLWARLFVRGVIRTKAAFHRTDLMEWHYISGSWGGPWISALLLPGLAVTLRQWRRPAPALLAIWFTLAVLLLGILSGFPPQDTHLVVVTPAVALLYAVTIVTVATILMTFARAGRGAAIGLAAPAFDRVRAELPGWLLSRHDDSAGNPVAFTLRRP